MNETTNTAPSSPIPEVAPLDKTAIQKAKIRQDALAKPPGSLGRLEELSIQLAGITGRVQNTLDKKAVLVFCADNGVTEEGVASAPQSVTAAQTINLVRGKTGAAVLAAQFGCSLVVCDVGVKADIAEPGVLCRKIAHGTNNITKTAAMTRAQAEEALAVGISLARQTVREGASVLGVGEMGIGNTTTSSAVLAALTGATVEEVTGYGGGLTEEGYRKKRTVIRQVLVLHHPNPADPLAVLAAVGGFDLAAMTGAFLGGASSRVPVIIDGFISAVAALCAVRLSPNVRDYLIPSHASVETGCRIAMRELGLTPLFDLGMRLGEGSGCPLAMMILDSACAVMNRMATFEEAGIADDYLAPIRRLNHW